MTIRKIGRLLGDEIAAYYDSFPWDEQTSLMKHFVETQPDNERSAPSLYIGDTLNDGKLSIWDGTLKGESEHVVEFTQFADRKKYLFFGPIVRREIDYCANHSSSYERSREYLQLYLEGKINELKEAIHSDA